MDHSDELAAAMNRQVTDEQGEIVGEETPQETSATQEQTTVEEDATAEKSAETEVSIPIETKETENEPEMVETASDETGKRYVPESRFKEVYAKWKQAERKAKAQGVAPPPMPVREPIKIDRADALETEFLKSTLPQFNPESEQYDRDLDEMGYEIYEASKGSLTRLEAARRALSRAKKITSKLADVKLEARSVKAQQSDQGITNRVLNRDETKVDPEKMSLEEKEEWLKAQGMWDNKS